MKPNAPLDAKFLRAITHASDAPKPALPAVAFVGRSNSGKSSLINTVVKHKGLARTSSTPGRTQEIVYFEIEGKLHFVDLPGYGFANAPLAVRSAWGPMIEKFLRETDALRLVVIILDARRIPSKDDLQMAEYLDAAGRPYIFALTKSDKLSESQFRRQIPEIQKKLGLGDDSALLPFSATTGRGRKELLQIIFSVLEAKN